MGPAHDKSVISCHQHHPILAAWDYFFISNWVLSCYFISLQLTFIQYQWLTSSWKCPPNSTKMTEAERPSTQYIYIFCFIFLLSHWPRKWLLCSMVWEKATEEDLFTPFRRTIGSLPWLRVDSGNPSYSYHWIFKLDHLSYLWMDSCHL